MKKYHPTYGGGTDLFHAYIFRSHSDLPSILADEQRGRAVLEDHPIKDCTN
jgi:hypothetical protein